MVGFFEKYLSQSRFIGFITFKVLLEQLWCKHHQKPPDVGRGGMYLFFVSHFTQFGNSWLHIHSFKGQLDQPRIWKWKENWSMTRCWGLMWKNWGVNIQFHGHEVVKGVFFSWMVVITTREVVGDTTLIRLNMLLDHPKLSGK
jgi:hypothetical protein